MQSLGVTIDERINIFTSFFVRGLWSDSVSTEIIVGAEFFRAYGIECRRVGTIYRFTNCTLQVFEHADDLTTRLIVIG